MKEYITQYAIIHFKLTKLFPSMQVEALQSPGFCPGINRPYFYDFCPDESVGAGTIGGCFVIMNQRENSLRVCGGKIYFILKAFVCTYV